MPRSRSSDNSFPLSSHSRARRRVALIKAASAAEPGAVPLEPAAQDERTDHANCAELDTIPEAIVVPMVIEEIPNDTVVEGRSHFTEPDQDLPIGQPELVAGISEPESTINFASAEFRIGAPPDTGAEIGVHDSGERAVDFHPFRELLKKTKPVTWVFTGDSITLGARHTDGWRNYSEHFAERIRWELRRARDVVINTATATETSRSLLSDFEWRVLRFRPDVVSVMIGINDAAAGRTRYSHFRKNLRHVVECIRADGALALFHTPPHIDVNRVISHTELRSYVKCVRDIARELDVACIDHWAHWKRTAGSDASMSSWLSADGLHPSAAGHRALALLLFRRFGIFDAHSPTCAMMSR